jgi:hypothetical protein
MALVRKFEIATHEVQKVHGKVRCTYSTFTAADGRKYFQIDTYGSPNRKFKEKQSQTIQLDEDSARALVSLLKSEFSQT